MGRKPIVLSIPRVGTGPESRDYSALADTGTKNEEEEQTTLGECDRLEKALRDRIEGEVRFDYTSRILYSTDASNYQFMPVGVVLPKDTADVVAALEIAASENVPVTPRGAGTSLAGQTVGNSLIIDFSKYMNRILEIDPERQIARVQPGVPLIALNNALKPHKLVLGPDPATQNRCNLGGMIANNTSGSHSIVYGKTCDHTQNLQCVLADGTVIDCGPRTLAETEAMTKTSDRAGQIARKIWELLEPHREEILAKYPKIPRRVSGYNFDTVLESEEFNLADIVVGSEGTLATVTEATLTLADTPLKKGLALLAFPDRFSALDSVPTLLKTNTRVLEMIDYRLLEMSRQSPEHRDKMKMIDPDVKGVLILEFGADEMEPILQDMEKLKVLSKDLPGTPTCLTFTDEATQEDVWTVREAGLGLLTRRSGPIKSVEFVEDTAVPPSRLGEYVRRLEEIFAKHDTASSIYGHAGPGCLHIRLDMTLRTAEGVKKMRDIAEEVTDVVIEFGGVYSGEHGDGISRSEFLPKLYGKTILDLHREVKKVFDPAGIMNPGKIVDPLPLDKNLRFGPDYHSINPKTYFDFADEEGYNMAVEACNGIGACRKLDAGTMCPSYQVTLEETHSTRGRANALREALKGNFDGLGDKRVVEVLDLCVECKGCKRECPVGVDMSRYKAEYMAQYYDIHGVPVKVRAFGHIGRLAATGSIAPGLANWFSAGPFSGLIKAVAGIHPDRKLPVLAKESFRKWFKRNRPKDVLPLLSKEGGRGRLDPEKSVILLDDSFNGYFKPETLIAAVEVLERAGFHVVITEIEFSEGRSFLSKGMLKNARKCQEDLVKALAPMVEYGVKLVGVEPSCTLTLRDEMPALARDERAKTVGENAYSFEEFLMQFAPDFRPGRLNANALVHGHCHQKSLCGTEALDWALSRIEGLTYTILDSGCCGMAGAFGYEKDHYDISRAIGERVLLPAVRALRPEDLVVADGYSCRTQIADFCDGRKAITVAELLAMAEAR